MVKNGHNSNAIISLAFASAGNPDFGFEILELAEVVRRVGHAHFARPHRLEFCQVTVLRSGSAVQEVDFVHYKVRPGLIVFTRPGQVQRLALSKDCQGALLVFRPEFVSGGPHGVELRDIAPLTRSPSVMENALRTLAEEYAQASRDRHARSIIVHEATALVLRLQRASESAAGKKDSPAAALVLFRRFESLVDQTLRAHRSAGLLARELGCSDRTLRRACLALTGQPPKTWIQQRVALEAKRALAHTDEPVQVIASLLGFSEPTNFVKFFRRVTGELPGAFRSRVQSASLGGPQGAAHK